MPYEIVNDRRRNNFGALRLLFAICVIVSHSPELVDGNRSRELLTRLFGTLSFGELGVDGFFIISGYLVTKSFVTRQSTQAYLSKRILRIYPGYLVNFLLCVFALSLFVVSHPQPWNPKFLSDQVWAMLHLEGPGVPGTFGGLHYPALNGSAWTISYEFRCYLLTIALGLVGCYRGRGRYVMLAGVVVCLMLTAGSVMAGAHWHREAELGRPEYLLRFFGIYGVGAVFFLFRDVVLPSNRGALVAAFVLAGLMFSHALAQLGWTVFGGYLIFWFALRVPVLKISIFENKADISYGLYLYAWPIQNLTIYVFPSVDPWLLCGLTIVIASLLGLVSWVFIEAPALRFTVGRSQVA